LNVKSNYRTRLILYFTNFTYFYVFQFSNIQNRTQL
jgi:hypothetical protein